MIRIRVITSSAPQDEDKQKLPMVSEEQAQSCQENFHYESLVRDTTGTEKNLRPLTVSLT